MNQNIQEILAVIDEVCDQATSENDIESMINGSCKFSVAAEQSRIAAMKFEWLSEYTHLLAISAAARLGGNPEVSQSYGNYARRMRQFLDESNFLGCEMLRDQLEAEGLKSVRTLVAVTIN
jgi:hypothetical protein